MPTARDVIELAAKEAGVLGVGQTLLAEDTNDILIYLKQMVAQFQRKRWLVPSLIDISTLGNGLISNPIGSGQYWNIPRPDKIQGGYIVQQNTGTTPVSLPLWPIFSYEDYIQLAIKNLNSLPDHFFYDGAYPVGNVFIWPIPTSQYEIHLLVKAQLGLSTTITTGKILNGGIAYLPGIYNNVPLVPVAPGNPTAQFQSYGTGALATITVSNSILHPGTVTQVAIQNGGEDFKVNDLLTASDADLGGIGGSGFQYVVTGTQSNLDSDMNFTPESEEAIRYNLALRICSAYQIEAQDSTIKFARSALNTLRQANIQVPSLIMPPTLRTGKAFNIYNADGY